MKTRSKQQGFALLIFITLLATASAALAVKVMNSGSNNQIARDKITAATLAQAKDALIGYAITYGDTHTTSPQVHGYLPCPDTSGTDIGGEGAAAGICGAKDVSSIGRLPWRTLDLSPLRGGDNECLWYAVSGTYKNSPETGLMNWDTNGQLQVYASDGTTLLTPADNQAVAIIFAPGSASPAQKRAGTTTPSCGGNYTASNYLDNDTVHHIDNANIATGKFIQSHEDRDARGNIILTVNDRMVFITKQDIWNALQKRRDFLGKLDTMTKLTAECIASFGKKNKTGTPPLADPANKSLPWPARLTLSDYGDIASYDDKNNLFAGRVSYKVNNSQGITHNSTSSPFSLLKSDGANCPIPADWAAIYPWWDNWKDHLFYAISQNYQPGNHATSPCDIGTCLSVNGAGKYAAVVMFAGKKLSGKTRADKSVVADYLEGRNATDIADPDSSGNEDYQLDPAGSTFNDIVYCIKENLDVVPGNPLATPVCPP